MNIEDSSRTAMNKCSKWNILLISIDCWRADHFSEEYTPNIFNIARKGFSFSNAYANSSWTPPSICSFLTSTYPFMYKDYSPIPPQKITVAEVLKSHGYYNYCINSNAYTSKFFGFNRGFDRYIETRSVNTLQRVILQIRDWIGSLLPKDARILRLFDFLERINDTKDVASGMKIPAIEMLSQARPFLKKERKPKFGWLHFMDCHSPYIPPSSYIKRFKELSPARINALNKYHRVLNRMSEHGPINIDPRRVLDLKYLYRASLFYVDDVIGKLLSLMKTKGYLDSTIIIFTADHGELFMEHGFMEHPARMYDELLRVPLILYLPPELQQQIGKPKTLRAHVSLLHLAPTLLDLVGIQAPHSYMGNTLVPMLKGESQDLFPIVSQSYIKHDHRKTIESTNSERMISIQNARWKYIHDTNGKDSSMLLSRIAPIDEENDLSTQHPELVMHFKQKTKDILDGIFYMKKNAPELLKIDNVIHNFEAKL